MKNYDLTLKDTFYSPTLGMEVLKARHITWDEFWSMNEEEMRAYLTINNGGISEERLEEKVQTINHFKKKSELKKNHIKLEVNND